MILANVEKICDGAAVRPKQGFTVLSAPDQRSRFATGPVGRRQPVMEIAHPDRVEALFRDIRAGARFACWKLLFYALWHRRHILAYSGGECSKRG